MCLDRYKREERDCPRDLLNTEIFRETVRQDRRVKKKKRKEEGMERGDEKGEQGIEGVD